MIRLALCDDEAEQRESVGNLLLEYAAARPSPAVKLSVFPAAKTC